MLEPTYSAVIADDHQLVRDGLRLNLEKPGLVTQNGLTVVAEAENGFEAIAEVKLHQPQLLFLDISMPLAGGAEILLDIRRWSPHTKVVVLTGSNAPGLICQIMESGVEGLFSKGDPLTELYEKLPMILLGGHFVAETFTHTLESVQLSEQLTERERQILLLVVAGNTNKQVSDTLSISPKTVDKHRTSLMNKLDVHSLAQLIRFAIRHGLVADD